MRINTGAFKLCPLFWTYLTVSARFAIKSSMLR